MHAPPEHLRVGAREVDVFEDALRHRFRRERTVRLHPGRADHHHLARLDVADERGVDQVEGARLRAEDLRLSEAAQRQRPEAPRVAHADDPIPGDENQRVGALHLLQGVHDRRLQTILF